MTYINNQYLKLDIPIEEIAKIEIKIDKNNIALEDLEINDYSNIIIVYGYKVNYNTIFGGVNYNNIFSGVKILITNHDALIYNNYKIPEYIKSIIVYGCVYNNNERDIERLKNSLDLIYALHWYNMQLPLEILKRTHNINLNQKSYYGHTALKLARMGNMGPVIFELLMRKQIDEICNNCKVTVINAEFE